MKNSIHKRGIAILTTIFMLFQFLPNQLIVESLNNDTITASDAFSASDVEREIYAYIRNKGFNEAATCGILAAIYLEPESAGFVPIKAGFMCATIKKQIDRYIDVMKMEATIKDSLIYNEIDEIDLSKKSYLYKLKNMSNSREGAYAAGKEFCDFLNQYFHEQSCPLSEDYAVLARDGFWPIYDSVETYIWPVPSSHSITSTYGTRDLGKGEEFHPAIDISGQGKGGQEIVASASGQVIEIYNECTHDYPKSGDDNYYDEHGYGIRIVIKHTDGYSTCYSHMRSINQDILDQYNQSGEAIVSQGQPIGIIGCTGRSSGCHLDFEVRKDDGKGVSKNPLSFIGLVSCDQYPGSRQYLTYIDSLTDYYDYSPNSAEFGGVLRNYDKGVYVTTDYLNIRSGSSTNYPTICSVPPNSEIEVFDISNIIWGKTIYNGREGWICLNYTTYLRPLELIKKPNVPLINLETANDVAQNAISSVSWDKVNGADSYNIFVYNESNDEVVSQSGITSTQTSFTLSDVGTYTVKGVSVNSKYTSDIAEMPFKIIVHPNSTVSFISEVDGNLLNKQSVPYGSDATLPETPTKKGFTFIGWDGNYIAVKQDTTIIAKWQRNKYNVNFYNGDGSTLDSQQILYEEAAKEPQAPTMKGYVFKGWDKKFDYIEDNMDIYPIFVWEKEDLPVIINDVKAERDSTGYNVSYSLKSAPGKSTQCRLVISLKTTEGKLITYTESNAYNLREDSIITDTIYFPSQEVASIVEIHAVRKFTLVIPIAENKTAKVTGNAFTNWSTEKPPSDAFKVEQRTEYRYRTKTIKESNEKLPSPWVLEKETTGYTDYGPEQRSDTPILASDTRSVEVKTEQHHDFSGYRLDYYCTQYYLSPYYRHYRSFSIGEDFGRYEARLSYGENTNTGDPNWVIYATQAELDAAGKVYPGDWYNGGYGGYNKDPDKIGYYFPNHWDPNIRGYLWFVTGETYNDYTTTYYVYKERKKIPVYTYSQLSDYSAWSIEKPESNGNRVIEERTVYRYVPSNINTTENIEGVKRTISGSVDASFAGKQAILFVYKIDEAADYTNEAVAQTTIGENGEFSFDIKLREEPTSMSINGEKKPTGDFTVTLGIEGTSSVIYLDPIKAPIPEYTVEYVDYDGKLLLSTIVKDGEAAPIPDTIPERKGYTFVGWNNNPSEIHSNVTMTAIYKKNEYTIAFIDWENESVILQQYNYGDSILPPEVSVPAGLEFKGWDIMFDENFIVTENHVAVAIYEFKQFEVSFVDYNRNLISTQTVQYGKTVVLPEALDDLTDRSFVCWSISPDTIITDNIVVEPVVSYFETAETPLVSLKSDAYDTEQMVEISTSDESKIYYTLDGSDPSKNGIEYTEKIKITNSCVLKCISKDTNKNNSNLVIRYYAINSRESVTDFMDYNLLPEYVRDNVADYNVISTIGYRYLMKVNVESNAQYENLIKSGWNKESESWSEWSDWNTSLDYTSDKIIEQRIKDAEPVEVPFYQYSHWKYYDDKTKNYQYSASEIEGVECQYESIESPDKLSIVAFTDGISVYSLDGQMWYNQKPIIKSVIPSDKLYQYRYKIITMTKLSDWVEKLPVGVEAVEEGEVFCYVEPMKYIVEIKTSDGYILYKNLELANKTLAIDSSILNREGFIVDGLVDAKGEVWDIDNDVITENVVLQVEYVPITYTVKFKTPEGDIISEEIVSYNMSVTPPLMENNDKNVFVGWDSDEYLLVTEDLEITAKYIPIEEMPSLKSAENKYYLYPGNTRILTAKTENIDKELETIIWTSMNPNIATVTDDGKLVAISEGETDIVISELSSGLMAICTVDVAANPLDDSDDTTSTTTTTDISSTTTVSKIPDNHIASDKKLCEWAENDYQNKNGFSSINTFVQETETRDYEIIITDKSGNVLEIYTINPETGKGVNSEGEEVNLPQTGNNSFGRIIIIISSLVLIGVGLIAMYASGILRRKKNE